MDDDDASPAPFTLPAGYRVAESQPTPSQLEFKNQEAEQLVGKKILFNWPGVGWCVGVITERNTDGRRKVASVPANFVVHYQIDDNLSTHALSLDEYGQREEANSWVLLEEAAVEEAAWRVDGGRWRLRRRGAAVARTRRFALPSCLRVSRASRSTRASGSCYPRMVPSPPRSSG